MKVLYLRVPDEVHAELAAVAELGGVSQSAAAVAIIAGRLGVDPGPLAPAVKRAIQLHQRTPR